MNKLKRPFTDTQMPIVLAGAALTVLIIIIVVFMAGGPDETDRLDRLENAVNTLETRVLEMDQTLSRVRRQEDVVEMLINKVDVLDEATPERIEALENQLAHLKRQLTGSDSRPTPDSGSKTVTGEGDKQTAANAKTPVKRPTTTKSKVDYHVVKAGETLYQISRQHKVSVAKLRRMNNIKEGDLIRTGQKLIVNGKTD